MGIAITVPGNVVEQLRKEAERLGLTLDEYLADLALQKLDPP